MECAADEILRCVFEDAINARIVVIKKAHSRCLQSSSGGALFCSHATSDAAVAAFGSSRFLHNSSSGSEQQLFYISIIFGTYYEDYKDYLTHGSEN